MTTTEILDENDIEIIGLNLYQIEELKNYYLICVGELPPKTPPPPECSHERSIKNVIDDGYSCRSVCVRCGANMIADWKKYDKARS